MRPSLRENVEYSRTQFVEPIDFEIGAWMVQLLPQLNSTQMNWFFSSIIRLANSDSASLVQRFSKRRSKHALSSIHKSCKLQNNWFQCDGLGKMYSPICQTLFSTLTSMRCAKTISRPGKVSYLKSLLTLRPMLHCCSLTKEPSSMPHRPIAVVSVVVFLFFRNSQSKARWTLNFRILLASPSSGFPHIEWMARGHVFIPEF